MKICLAEDDKAVERVLEVLLELRLQYTSAELQDQVLKQISAGYKLAFVEEDGIVISVAGFVISEKLAWGKHIYIDDFVSRENVRSKGAGKILLDWIKKYGRKMGCTQIHLDSGVQRFGAHKFYLREGFKIASHHFSAEL